MSMKRTVAAAVLLVAAGAATAQARMNVDINLNVPVAAPPPAVVYQPEIPPPSVPPPLVIEEAPRFIYAPELGFAVSVDIPYDIAYINQRYYLYSGGYWYLSRTYWGPWSFVSQRRLPLGLRKHRYEQIRLYRDREYQVYARDRDHYRGSWYRPAGGRAPERRVEHQEERREERHEEMRDRR